MRESLRKFLLFVLLHACSIWVLQAQEYKNEFGIQSDNDAYLWYGQDRYYTNGFFISYRHAPDQSKFRTRKLEKVVYSFSIGQQMYTPFSGFVPERELQDRPFAGYLFGRGQVNFLYKNEQVLKVGLSLGTVGPNSFAREAQNLLHNTIGLYSTSGWDDQIGNSPAFNLHSAYAALIYRRSNDSFDLSLESHLDLGTTFTGMGAGLLFRIGDINQFFHSAYHQARVGHNGNIKAATEREFYFYAKPQLHYVAYDATIQGSFFVDNSPVTFAVRPLVFEQKIGVNYSSRRFSLDYSLTFRSKELQSPARQHQFGTISSSYRF
ncbi:lipid A deacylase LpxR family protein [Sphingobacterium bambusae]|uniref:Lipid A deacylase LpxR family protein n=1 Tax=Sphingobacterium bambusae TaxID=662858 RepID=A0ABW6BLS7_9SPHI|nr:lipid A deacylase LpxR family protein [Sphingobacterium bambusae]WPL48187.1 lipid A deacylase LpxR family protein [Sphingobacterium bambusae]